jgi:two-component system, chemotaxis family, protein-glutamate methylesterase/glutaminase
MSIRVMIVDDSAFIRRAVRRILGDDPELVVVGEAGDGHSALREVERLGPDVVTLDLRMPGLDGVETIEHLMAARPTPVVLLSSYAQVDAALTLRALAAGAVDFVDKSQVSTMNVYELGHELVHKLKAAAASHPRRRNAARDLDAPIWSSPSPTVPPSVVVLGASTGGPAALEAVLGGIPADTPLSILIVQHMPRGFTGALARRLGQTCALPVREAQSGDRLRPGRVLVAPGGHDLRVVDDDGCARIQIDAAEGRALPRLDVALDGLAAAFGPALCAVVLTGMGRDGLAGARRVRDTGGTVITEARSTCVLYGMPRVVTEAGLASCVAPLDAIAGLLERMARDRRSAS